VLPADLRAAASAVVPEQALDLERAATEFVRAAADEALEPAQALLDADDATEGERVFAATVAVVASRRLHRPDDARRALLALGDRHDALPLVWHLRSLVSMLVGTDEAVRDAVETAEVAYAGLPEHPGVVHTLAWALVESAERDGADPADPRYERALPIVDEAIDLLRAAPPEDRRLMYRGRFFHTRARIRRRRGDAAGARADLQRAIAAEDRQAPDYFLRIADYTIEQSLLTADRTLRQLEDAIDAGTRRLEAAELGTVGAVGFVAATIGLIQVTVAEVTGHVFWQSIVIVAAFGVVLFGAVAAGTAALRRARRPAPLRRQTTA
jgi:hypothetical protein